MSLDVISEQEFDKIIEAAMRVSMAIEKKFLAEFNALSYGVENPDFVKLRGEVFADYLIGTMCALLTGISDDPKLRDIIVDRVDEKLSKLVELRKEFHNGVRKDGHTDDSIPPSVL